MLHGSPIADRTRFGHRRPTADLVRIVAILATLLSVACSSQSFMLSAEQRRYVPTEAELAAVHAPDGLRRDLDELVELHERTSPAPYLRVERDRVVATRDRLKAAITAPMTRREFLPLLMELQASYGVDHVVLSVPDADLERGLRHGDRLVPFRAVPTGEGLHVVTVAATDDVESPGPGDIITAINGIDAQSIGRRIEALVPGESDEYRRRRIVSSFRSLVWALSIDAPFTVDWIDANGVEWRAVLTGVDASHPANERTATTSAGSCTDEHVIVDSPPFRALLVDGDIALIECPTLDGMRRDRWSAFLVETFVAVRDRGCVGVIVDIRRNGGGDSSLGELLLAHLTDRPYRMAGAMEWRKSAEGMTSLEATVKPQWRWLVPIGIGLRDPEFSWLPNGGSVVREAQVAARPRRQPTFDGPTCLLIGPVTFSSAMMLADAVRSFDLMTTVGQPTGGHPSTLGELGFSTLPTSRIRVQFCQKRFLRASGDEADLGPVVPHVLVDERDEPATGRDATVDAAIRVIRGN